MTTENNKNYIIGVDLAHGVDGVSITPQTAVLNKDEVIIKPGDLEGESRGNSTLVHYDEVEFEKELPQPSTLVQAAKGAKSIRGAFNIKEKISGYTNMINEMTRQQKKVLGESHDDVSASIEAAIADLTQEQIANLTADEINAIYTHNGQPININGMDDDAAELEFKHGFLKWMKLSALTREAIEEDQKKMEEAWAESEKEMKELASSSANYTEYMYDELHKRLDNAQTEEEKNHFTTILKHTDDGTSLESIIEYYKTQKIYNVIGDWKSVSRTTRIFERYQRNAIWLNVPTDITKFTNLESKFLPEKYHAYNDLFTFAIIRYISYIKEPSKTTHGVFLSMFMYNMKQLSLGALSEVPERTEQFKQAIIQLLDVLIDGSTRTIMEISRQSDEQQLDVKQYEFQGSPVRVCMEKTYTGHSDSEVGTTEE